MAVDIKMRGELEPIRVEGGFLESVNTLDMSAAKGLSFVKATADDNGDNIALSMENILTIREVSEDED